MRVLMLIVMIMHLDIGKSTSHKSPTEPIPKLLVLFLSFFLAYLLTYLLTDAMTDFMTHIPTDLQPHSNGPVDVVPLQPKHFPNLYASSEDR